MSDPTPSPNPADGQRPAEPTRVENVGDQPASDRGTVKPLSAAKAAPKPPAPEDAPFSSFIPEVFIPALAREIVSYGGPEPTLRFEQGPMPVVGGSCWMVCGDLPGPRRFWLCFTTDSISSAKTIALAEVGAEPSLLESFLIDEKKMTLPLLVSRLVQRLNGQKWLGPN